MILMHNTAVFIIVMHESRCSLALGTNNELVTNETGLLVRV